MRRFLYLFACLIVICLATACSKPEVHHFSELKFQATPQGITATSQDESAHGEYWSEDGKSMMMLFDQGQLQHIDYYTYPDHQLFCRYYIKKSEFFNQKGHLISEALAKASCAPVYTQFMEQRKELSHLLVDATRSK